MKLFIDTHDEKITISIIDKEVTTISKITNHEHSKYTLFLIDELLKKNNYTKKDINEIIVVNGPGSFTGVRIGVVIAKTLAYTLNIPIKTITSLEAYGVSEKNKFDLIYVKDPKGYYYMTHKNGQYDKPMYKKNDEFEKMVQDEKLSISANNDLDILSICDYVKNKKSINPNEVNPVYVKRIMND